MAERLNRKELYDLVWSEPMKTLSARFGISDVALKKACARVGIQLRKYVEAIRLALSRDESSSTEELEGWSQWALAQADRIDPVIGGKFLTSMRDDDAP